MSFSSDLVPLWRKIVFTILIMGCLLGTMYGLAVWEYWQCGDHHEGYCRERNYLDVLVIGGVLLMVSLVVFFAAKLLLREPS